MSIVAKTGRRTHISASFCIGLELGALCFVLVFGLGSWVLVEQRTKSKVQRPKTQALLSYSHPITEQFKIAGRDLFVGGNAAFDFDQIAFSLSRLHDSLLCVSVLDHEH